jgi:esterase/lipase superfamily enzyme
MIDLGGLVFDKLRRLLDYRQDLEGDPVRNAVALAVCDAALAEVAQLVIRLISDPGSAKRRLADIDLVLNQAFDDGLDPVFGLREGRERSNASRHDLPSRVHADALKEIARVLIDAGYLPSDATLDAGGASAAPIAIPDGLHSAHGEIHADVDSTDDSAVNAEYFVWFGTNRRPVDINDPNKGFSSERDAAVHRGRCRVFVPKSHKYGSIGSNWWQRLWTSTDDRLRLLGVVDMAEANYWRAVSASLSTLPVGERHAVVFVHGYNVTFEQAALRAAQVGFDLSIKNSMAFFSWPSKGAVNEYAADEATIESSEGAITQFLVDFVERSGAEAVHVIAHSMGNRALLRAVDRIATRAERQTGKHFGQIILAAADVDVDLFRELCGGYNRVARRTTLYVSTRDRAIEASRWLHAYPRVGLTPPVVIVPGIDTIDVANIDLTLIGHGYVAGARDVLKDMHDLIARNLPPKSRFGLRRAFDGKGGRYWIIGA